MLDAPTSTRHVHCETVQNVFKVQNSHRELCLFSSTGDVASGHYSAACVSACATPKVCREECTEIVTEQSVCVAISVLLQTVGWSVLHGHESANHCLTRRSVLYTKAGASCFVVPC